ncbi:hypothetical protein R1sor_025639 [Riccia sorocarpa]|uniref:Uncharacterized protein n=1 Tax=Riccia sorocarpa TaxID=122646 RepID=A0ABD3GAQ3_9MARC
MTIRRCDCPLLVLGTPTLRRELPGVEVSWGRCLGHINISEAIERNFFSTSHEEIEMERGKQPTGDENPIDDNDAGFFDHVAAVLNAFQHPVILVEEAAMRWMGVAVHPEYNLDLLIKDSQLDDIVAEFLASGLYERVEQDLHYRHCRIRLLKQVPRLRRIDEHVLRDIPLNFWAESIYKLSTESRLVEVPGPIGWNLNLVEERFDPVPWEGSISYQTKLAQGIRMLPDVLALSAAFHCPIYVPSIPCFVDALLDQIPSRPDRNMPIPLSYLIRYLHLEKPCQRQKLMPELAKRNQEEMQIYLDKYKRKMKFDLRPYFETQGSQGFEG